MRMLRMTLSDITADDIYALAGHTLAGRGYDDYESGLVKDLNVRETTIDADVAGRLCLSYTVRIWIENDGLDGHCNCPYSQGLDVCQHVAAVLFEWVYGNVGEIPVSRDNESRLRQELEHLSKSDLTELVMESVKGNTALCQKFRALVKKFGSGK